MEQTCRENHRRDCAEGHGVPPLCADTNAADRPEWFPMRVTYNREQKVKEALDVLGIENFLPMHYEVVDNSQGRQLKLVPAIHNLLFIRSDFDTLTNIKHTRQEFEPLRFMTRPQTKELRTLRQQVTTEILRVPDRQMENFMRVASIEDDRVMFLDYNEFVASPGRRVKVTAGPFAGVEGTVKRIKNNRHVVVQIEGVAAVAIAYVPTRCLIKV